jgi:hypothetical protein
MKPIYIKLDPEKDKDIIEFIEGKPKTFIVKEALRHYMKIYQAMTKPVMHIEERKEEKPLFQGFSGLK